MKKAIAKIFIALISTEIHANSIETSTRCLTSINRKTNVKFVEISKASDQINIAYVKYEKSDTSIPLYLITKSEEVTDKDRPAEVTKKWLEILNGKPNGEYTVTSQGAQVYTFTYKGKRGNLSTFNYNTEATADDYSSCSWEKQ